MDDAPFIRTLDLVKDYPGVRAVDHVSLDLHRGELVGLVGKNGAGKSSVIKILAGAIQPDAGEIHLDGDPITISHPHQATTLGLSFVHQELSVVPELSVAENVELGLGYPRRGGVFVNWTGLRNKAGEVLHRLGEDIDPKAPMSSLSVAHTRLVMVARALSTDARLVVLDEPTSSLTEEEIEQLHRILRGMAAEGVCILYVSHRLDEIFEITERVVVMRDGAVVADRPTTEFDSRSLIEEITGADASDTTLERRRSRGIGGPPETAEAMRVEGIAVQDLVHSASFAVHQGEILGLAGLIGAGRTELVRALYGADRRDAGEVYVHGELADTSSPKASLNSGIVLLPEDRRQHGVILGFGVRSNVTLGSLPNHRVLPRVPFPSVRSERQSTDSQVESLDIMTPSHETPAALLSGGNQQKLVLARWLERGADVFIFDEATAGIDVGAKEEIYLIMEELASQGHAIIFISSEFGELVGVCHRVIVMREGRLVAELEGDDITETRLLEHCYGHHETEAA